VIKEEAVKASKNGATAAFISAGLGLLTAVFAISSNLRESTFSYYYDPSVFIDILIVVTCGFGLLRYSRAAAVVMFIYWIFTKTYQVLETGTATGLILGLVFLYFFGKAIQGTFAYHKISKTESPDYKPTSKWTYVFGIPLLVLLLASASLGLLSMTDYMPTTNVVSGERISAADLDLLTKNQIIIEIDIIEYFYSYGFTSVLEGGSILSDSGVTAYQTNEQGEVETYWLPYEQIASVELVEMGNFLNDSVYRVNGFGEDSWLLLYLSAEEGGDVRFVEALRKNVAARKTKAR
jgi:hypothetical protein